MSPDGALVGIITYDDLVEFLAYQLSELSGLLERQVAREREDRP